MRLEKARALERVTQRHRNTGSWIKGALRKAGHKEGTREAIREQLRVGDELRRKMDVGSSSDEEYGDADAGRDDEEDVSVSSVEPSSVEVSVELSESDGDAGQAEELRDSDDGGNGGGDGESRTAGGKPLPQVRFATLRKHCMCMHVVLIFTLAAESEGS